MLVKGTSVTGRLAQKQPINVFNYLRELSQPLGCRQVELLKQKPSAESLWANATLQQDQAAPSTHWNDCGPCPDVHRHRVCEERNHPCLLFQV